MDRDTFATRQAAMSATWYENVKRREGDVEAYIAKREAAYLDRWKEAGRFIADGSRVLDVGGGNLFPLLLDYLKTKSIDYYYLDIDKSAVESSRRLAEGFGFNGANFLFGFNDSFEFSSNYFDSVFSSHCIEHSINLPKTFAELHRIVKAGGNLFIAVPLGWEKNPEHPYFFGPDHWIALVEDAGFEIRVAQIGREYPEHGYDLFLAARKSAHELRPPRVNADEYCKESYTFIPHDDPCIVFSGDKYITPDGSAAHVKGNNWSIQIALTVRARIILPIFMRHAWSAQIQISSLSEYSTFYDLFSWFPYVQPCRDEGPYPEKSHLPVVIHPIGQNPSSWGTEGVLYGVLYR